MQDFRFLFLGIEQQMVTKWPWDRSPGSILVDLCSTFKAGAVGSGPGPNFGRKPAQNLSKLNYRFEFPSISPSQCGSPLHVVAAVVDPSLARDSGIPGTRINPTPADPRDPGILGCRDSPHRHSTPGFRAYPGREYNRVPGT